MVEKYVEKDIYVSRKNTVNYWCSKINIIITFNNGVSKSKRDTKRYLEILDGIGKDVKISVPLNYLSNV